MGRHLDDRLALRAPRSTRRLAKLVLARPPGSPLRRRLAKRAVAHGFEAVARGDDGVALLAYDRDFEFNIVGDAFGALGFAERYHRQEGWHDWRRLWHEAWVNARYTPEELIDLGDRMIVRLTILAQGASSGAEVVQTTGNVYYLRDGAVVRQDFYWDWSECVEALGLFAAAPANSG
jgi:ketosteroid isomerase-like protein